MGCRLHCNFAPRAPDSPVLSTCLRSYGTARKYCACSADTAVDRETVGPFAARSVQAVIPRLDAAAELSARMETSAPLIWTPTTSRANAVSAAHN